MHRSEKVAKGELEVISHFMGDSPVMTICHSDHIVCLVSLMKTAALFRVANETSTVSPLVLFAAKSKC